MLGLRFSKTLTFVSCKHALAYRSNRVLINLVCSLLRDSDGMVPASLTHTVKSSSAVFSVLLSRVMSGRWPSLATSISLFPIACGVTLAALTELEFDTLGFLAALVATLANVGHSAYSKQVLRKTGSDPLILHMYTSALSLVLLAPYVLLKNASDIARDSAAAATAAAAAASAAAAAANAADTLGGQTNLVGSPVGAGSANALDGGALGSAAGADAGSDPLAVLVEPQMLFPAMAFLLSNILHYLQVHCCCFLLAIHHPCVLSRCSACFPCLRMLRISSSFAGCLRRMCRRCSCWRACRC